MALAEQEDVEARLRRELTVDESSYINAVLDEASSLVTEHCGGREFNPIPDAVRIVTSRVAARAFAGNTLPAGAASTTLQALAFQQTTAYTPEASSGGVYLTRVDKRQLRRWSTSHVYSFDTR